MAEHPVAKTLRGLADALSGAPPRLKIAFTALEVSFPPMYYSAQLNR